MFMKIEKIAIFISICYVCLDKVNCSDCASSRRECSIISNKSVFHFHNVQFQKQKKQNLNYDAALQIHNIVRIQFISLRLKKIIRRQTCCNNILLSVFFSKGFCPNTNVFHIRRFWRIERKDKQFLRFYSSRIPE